MIILSIDLGKARTGIAICDKNMVLASPVCVIEEWNRDRLAQRIISIVHKHHAEKIVIGLPKNMNGSDGESALAAREFAEKLSELVDIPIEMHDERCTTMIAHQYLNDTNTRGKKRKQTVDAVAATIILQSYIDSLKNTQGDYTK